MAEEGEKIQPQIRIDNAGDAGGTIHVTGKWETVKGALAALIGRLGPQATVRDAVNVVPPGTSASTPKKK